MLLPTLALLALHTAPQQEPHLTLSPPAKAVRAGETVPIGVYFLNTAATELKLVPPAAIAIRLVSSASEVPLELTRAPEFEGREETIAPGASILVPYQLVLPADAKGRLVVQPDRQSGAPAVIDVTTDGETRPESTPTEPVDPERESVRAPPKFAISELAIGHLSGHEPMYFIVGTEVPNARFQISFKYRLANVEGPLASKSDFFSGLYIGYTQRSLWDLESSSTPFTDNTYAPEFFWSQDDIASWKVRGVSQIGFQTGIYHESNGQAEEDSRSITGLFVRPYLFFGDPERFHWRVDPKIAVPIVISEHNSDIDEYRGYVDLRVTAGRTDGLEVSLLGRIGSTWENGSLQVDATYPLRAFGPGNFDLFLQAQYFTGYGESLITYDERTESFRLGIGLVR